MSCKVFFFFESGVDQEAASYDLLKRRRPTLKPVYCRRNPVPSPPPEAEIYSTLRAIWLPFDCWFSAVQDKPDETSAAPSRNLPN